MSIEKYRNLNKTEEKRRAGDNKEGYIVPKVRAGIRSREGVGKWERKRGWLIALILLVL